MLTSSSISPKGLKVWREERKNKHLLATLPSFRWSTMIRRKKHRPITQKHRAARDSWSLENISGTSERSRRRKHLLKMGFTGVEDCSPQERLATASWSPNRSTPLSESVAQTTAPSGPAATNTAIGLAGRPNDKIMYWLLLKLLKGRRIVWKKVKKISKERLSAFLC